MAEDRSSGERVVLSPGTRVGHYSIIEKLGEGGEAVVYRARDLLLERDVALKTPRCEFATPKECAHLLKEARAASRLSHPAIVPIHEVFEDQGKPWFAMDLVEGATLRTVLGQRGALPPEDVARHGEALASALHAAHTKNVLHRDVTPGNVFITSDGRLMLGDFGLALLPPGGDAAGPDAQTISVSREHVAGTLGYMSPEQMLGREVGPASDIFSAGVVLYQMATGVRPFRGDTLGEVLDATLAQEPPPITSRGNVPSELGRIIQKALAKRPDERYASAGDMCIDLRALRRKLESGNHAPEPVPTPRPRLRWIATVGVGVLAVAALATWGWQSLRRPGLPEATPHQVTTGSGWEAEAKISPNGSDIVFTAEGPDGNVDIYLVDAMGGSTPTRLTDHPAVDRSPTWYPDGRAVAFTSERKGTPDVWKRARLGNEPPTFVVANAQSPAISPDGTRLAFTRAGEHGSGRIFVAPLAAPDKAKVLTTDKDGLWDHESPAWSPDGRTICYASHSDLWTVDADTGRTQPLTSQGESDFEPAWSRSGWIYFTSLREQTTAIWRIRPSGNVPLRVTMGIGPENQPSLSGGGNRLSYSTFSTNRNVVIRIRATGKEYEVGGERAESAPALAPDGSAIAYSSNNVQSRHDLWVQPLSGVGAPSGGARRLTDLPGSATHPSYSPDSRWIAFFRVLEQRRDVWIVPADGGEAVNFTNESGANYHPDWSPRGDEIAFISERDGVAHVWVAPVKNGAPAGSARRLTEGPSSHMAPSWSPDASMVAYVSTDALGRSEAWVVAAKGDTPAIQVTQGSRAGRVGWGAPGHLLVSGSWGLSSLALREINLATRVELPYGAPRVFGHLSASGEFAVSRDGRLLVLERTTAKGDLWTLKAERGEY